MLSLILDLPYHAKQAEILRLWVLERYRGMESKTTRRIHQKFREKTKTTDEEKLVSQYGLPNCQAQSSHARMDKLF